LILSWVVCSGIYNECPFNSPLILFSQIKHHRSQGELVRGQPLPDKRTVPLQAERNYWKPLKLWPNLLDHHKSVLCDDCCGFRVSVLFKSPLQRSLARFLPFTPLVRAGAFELFRWAVWFICTECILCFNQKNEKGLNITLKYVRLLS
jgi:hypothetical protein